MPQSYSNNFSSLLPLLCVVFVLIGDITFIIFGFKF